ncbi:PhaM family polyhydroxyalkanoate granule multifunctional regulatory protein [Ramlibacter sp. PS3R-8]|uniref:PhaM family polyhydroxyalkanoate granule multifunctional regulatory protein n=1 Tax=Ramlibacter sp. PS3R-8 TaxID=3133437 RepID=UPI0030AA37ED
MSDNNAFGFGRFVPGFDFLQNIAKGASQGVPQMPQLSSWVAPTLNVEELEKRISELKAVHFWLDQNGKALGATIQALEVQKMTLSTLQGMNFNMGEVANALKLKTAETTAGGARKAGAAADAGAATAGAAVRKAAPESTQPVTKAGPGAAAGAAGAVDPMQWWGALTSQFQEIAANTMKDVTPQSAMDTARNMAASVAGGTAVKGVKKKPAKKSAPRKARSGS